MLQRTVTAFVSSVLVAVVLPFAAQGQTTTLPAWSVSPTPIQPNLPVQGGTSGDPINSDIRRISPFGDGFWEYFGWRCCNDISKSIMDPSCTDNDCILHSPPPRRPDDNDWYGGPGPGPGGGGGGGSGGSTGGWATKRRDVDWLITGASARTRYPVMAATGFKAEETSDLVVQLPGRDFELHRSYTSSPLTYSNDGEFGWFMGRGWIANIDTYLVEKQPASPSIPSRLKRRIELVTAPPSDNTVFYKAVTNMGPLFEHTSYPDLSTYTANMGDEFRPLGASLSRFYLQSYTYDGAARLVWVMNTPGEGQKIFYRHNPAMSSANSLTVLNAQMDGILLAEIDDYGNKWTYKYVTFTNSGSGTPIRLDKIFLGGESASDCQAVIQTAYDESGHYSQVDVLRPLVAGGTRYWIRTDYVKYIYSWTISGEHSDVGGGLIQVVQGILVNPPSTNNPNAAALESDQSWAKYHKRITQYRYDSVGLMRAVVAPQQIEYVTNERCIATSTLDNADQDRLVLEADRLLASADASALTLSGETWTACKLEDLFFKKITYGAIPNGAARRPTIENILSFLDLSENRRVSVEQRHSHKRWYIEENYIDLFNQGNLRGALLAWMRAALPLSASSTRLAEHDVLLTRDSSGIGTPSVSTSPRKVQIMWSIDREVYSEIYMGDFTSNPWKSPFIVRIRMPFTVLELNSSGEPVGAGGVPNPTARLTYTEYDEGHRLARTVYPSATDAVLVPTVTSEESQTVQMGWPYPPNATPPDLLRLGRTSTYSTFYEKSNVGVVEHRTYRYESLLAKRWLTKGGVLSPASITPIEEFTGAGVASRPDLVGSHKKYAADGVVEEETYSFTTQEATGSVGLGSVGVPHRVVLRTTARNRETTTQNGPASSGAVSNQTGFAADGLERWTRTPTGTLTAMFYDPSTGAVNRTLQNTTPARIQSFDGGSGWTMPGGVNTSGWTTPSGGELETLVINDLSGGALASRSPDGIWGFTQYLVEPEAGATKGASFLAKHSWPHKWVESSSQKFTGPMTKEWFNASVESRRTSSFAVSSMTIGSLGILETGSVGNEVGRSVTERTVSGQVVKSKVWHRLLTVSGNPSLDDSSSDKFYETSTSYDDFGRAFRTIDANGTITELRAFDFLNRPRETWQGTVAGSSGNMQLVSKVSYDGAEVAGSPSTYPELVGNGLVTRSWSPVLRVHAAPTVPNLHGTSTSTTMVAGGRGARDQRKVYDFRDRLILTYLADPSGTGAVGPYEATIYDGLDRPIEVAVIDSAQARLTVESQVRSVADSTSSAKTMDGVVTGVRKLTRTLYSVRGLTFRTQTAIFNSTGTITGWLHSDTWYDDSGQVLVQSSPGGPLKRNFYDGHGRVVKTQVSDRASVSTGFSAVVAGTSDAILDEVNTTYHTNSTLVSLVKKDQRRHDVTGTGLGSNPITTYAATAYDVATRPVLSINYGTNTADSNFVSGGTAPTVIGVGASLSSLSTAQLPTWAIVTKTMYDALGRAEYAIDAEGRISRSMFDATGKVFATVENVKNTGTGGAFSPQPPTLAWAFADSANTIGSWRATAGLSTTAPDENRLSTTVFDGMGHEVLRVAHIPKAISGGYVDELQATQYVYKYADAFGSSTVGTDSASESTLIASNSLLHVIRYPNDGDGSGTPGLPVTTGGDAPKYSVKMYYNMLGEQRAIRDQNGTVRGFYRDDAGRQLADRVLTFGNSAISQHVKQIGITYDTLGRQLAVTSYTSTGVDPYDQPATSLSSVANRVSYAYSPQWDVSEIRQVAAVNGTAAVGGEQIVRYNYTTAAFGSTSGVANTHRLTSIDYPEASGEAATRRTTLIRKYGSSASLDESLGRISELLVDDHGTSGSSASDISSLVKYSRLGLATNAITELSSPTAIQVDRTLAADGDRGTSHPTQSGIGYRSWDRFGRLQRHAWVTSTVTDSTSASTPGNVYHWESLTHDRTNLRLTVRNTTAVARMPGRDWDFAHDKLRRLTSVDRGLAGSGGTLGSTGRFRSQDWDLDTIGNWKKVSTDLDGDGSIATDGSESQVQGTNMANELESLEGKAPDGTTRFSTRTYDDCGNLLVEDTRATSGGAVTLERSHVYDAWNRLVLVQERPGTTGTPAPLAAYAYNGLNWRTAALRDPAPAASPAALSHATLFFFNSDWQCLEEHTDSDVSISVDSSGISITGFAADRLAQNFFGLRHTDDLIRRRIDAGTGSNPSSLGSPDGEWMAGVDGDWTVLTDARFCVVNVVARGVNAGAVLDRFSYDSYGRPETYAVLDFNMDGFADFFDYDDYVNCFENSVCPPGMTAETNMDGFLDFNDYDTFASWMDTESSASVEARADLRTLFSGYYWDPATGYMLSRMRWYDPGSGRWVTRDPAGYVDGLSMYLYCKDNPLGMYDPSGLWAHPMDGAGWDRHIKGVDSLREQGDPTFRFVEKVAVGVTLGAVLGPPAAAIVEGTGVVGAGAAAAATAYGSYQSGKSGYTAITGLDADTYQPVSAGDRAEASADFAMGIGGIMLGASQTRYKPSMDMPEPPTRVDFSAAPSEQASLARASSVVPETPGSPVAKISSTDAMESGSTVSKPKPPTVQENKASGDAFRDQVADDMTSRGMIVQTEVEKKTPFGPRRIDVERLSPEGVPLGGVETKVGGSRYTPSQRAKDMYLKRFRNYPVNVIRQSPKPKP